MFPNKKVDSNNFDPYPIRRTGSQDYQDQTGENPPSYNPSYQQAGGDFSSSEAMRYPTAPGYAVWEPEISLAEAVPVESQPEPRKHIEDEVIKSRVVHHGPIKVYDATIKGGLESTTGDIEVEKACAQGGITAHNGMVNILDDVDKVGKVEATTMPGQTAIKMKNAEIDGDIIAHAGDIQLNQVTAKKAVIAENGNIDMDYVDADFVSAPYGNISILHGCEVGRIQCGGMATLGRLTDRGDKHGLTSQSVTAGSAKLNEVIAKELTITAHSGSEPLRLHRVEIDTVRMRRKPEDFGDFSNALGASPLKIEVSGPSQINNIIFEDEDNNGEVSLSPDASVSNVRGGYTTYH